MRGLHLRGDGQLALGGQRQRMQVLERGVGALEVTAQDPVGIRRKDCLDLIGLLWRALGQGRRRDKKEPNEAQSSRSQH